MNDPETWRLGDGEANSAWRGTRTQPTWKGGDKETGKAGHRTLNLDRPRAEVPSSQGLQASKSPSLQVSPSIQAVLHGMQPGEVEAMQGFLGAEECAEDFTRVDAEDFNRAVLRFIERVAAVLNLRPCEVEARTGLRHQHLLKLRPQGAAAPEVHVTLCTLVVFCNGLHIRLQRAVEWITQRMLLWLMMLQTLGA